MHIHDNDDASSHGNNSSSIAEAGYEGDLESDMHPFTQEIESKSNSTSQGDLEVNPIDLEEELQGYIESDVSAPAVETRRKSDSSSQGDLDVVHGDLEDIQGNVESQIQLNIEPQPSCHSNEYVSYHDDSSYVTSKPGGTMTSVTSESVEKFEERLHDRTVTTTVQVCCNSLSTASSLASNAHSLINH